MRLAAVLLSADSSASHKSDVWQYYKEHKKAKCQLCSKELVFHNGTTNLREHLMNISTVGPTRVMVRKREAENSSSVRKAKVLFLV